MNSTNGKEKRKFESAILRNWLNRSVSREAYPDVKKRLARECLVRSSSFHNWLYGYCNIPLAAKRDINRVTMEISGREIFTIVYPEDADEGVSVNTSGETI